MLQNRDPKEIPRKYPDENKWLWEMSQELETRLG
jgi:hypothetical protein